MTFRRPKLSNPWLIYTYWKRGIKNIVANVASTVRLALFVHISNTCVQGWRGPRRRGEGGQRREAVDRGEGAFEARVADAGGGFKGS